MNTCQAHKSKSKTVQCERTHNIILYGFYRNHVDGFIRILAFILIIFMYHIDQLTDSISKERNTINYCRVVKTVHTVPKGYLKTTILCKMLRWARHPAIIKILKRLSRFQKHMEIKQLFKWSVVFQYFFDGYAIERALSQFEFSFDLKPAKFIYTYIKYLIYWSVQQIKKKKYVDEAIEKSVRD